MNCYCLLDVYQIINNLFHHRVRWLEAQAQFTRAPSAELAHALLKRD